MLVAVQACHSIEEYAFALYQVLPVARFASGLVSGHLPTGFAILNATFVAFGLWCYVVPIRAGWASARGWAWLWAIIELGNGLGHPLLALRAGAYFPGVATAPILLVLALYLAMRLLRSRSSPWAAAPVDERQAQLLRWAFLLGAVADALALIPLLVPSMARLLWGLTDSPSAYRFAAGYGASLMLGWTALLLWAYQRPLERRFVAALTVLVICALVVTEIVAVVSWGLEAWRMVPTWCLQAALLSLFVVAYHYPTSKRWLATRQGGT